MPDGAVAPTGPADRKQRRRGKGIVSAIICALVTFCLAGAGIIGYDMLRSSEKQRLLDMRTVQVFQPVNTMPAEDLPVPEDESQSQAVAVADPQAARQSVDVDAYARWYRSHLSEADKAVYDRIEAGLRSHESSISVSCWSIESLMRCFQYVMNDNVDIFWADESYEYMHYPDTGEIVSIQPKYSCSPAEAQQKMQAVSAVEAKALSAMSDAGLDPSAGSVTSDYDKARFLYGWVADYLSYDTGMADWQGLADTCQEKVSACAGYSRLFEWLCRKCGVACVYVTGEAVTGENESELHAWSIMNLDGIECYTDVTWGDKDGSRDTDYSWLALTGAHMGATHFLSDANIGVAAEDGRYETWNVNSTSFAVYDAASVQSRLFASIDANWKTISLFFEDDGEYERAYQEIAHSGMYPTMIAERYPSRFPFAYTQGVYSVRKETGLNVLTVTWKY